MKFKLFLLKKKNEQRETDDSKHNSSVFDAKSLKMELLNQLEAGESILGAIRRLGRGMIDIRYLENG